MKEHEKLGQKQVSKVTLLFVWGHLMRKQTVPRVFLGLMPSLWSKGKKAFKSPTFDIFNMLPIGRKSSNEKYHLSICQVGL